MADSDNTDPTPGTADSCDGNLKLSDLLDRGWKTFEEVDTTSEPIGSNGVQVKIRRGITSLEEVSRMVAQLDLFSRNEDLEEISTSDLKYLLLPALLGALTMKLTNRDKRLEVVNAAREYYHDFLRRCKEYNVSEFTLPRAAANSAAADEESENEASRSRPTTTAGPPDLVAMAAQRQAKIGLYKQRKLTEDRLAKIKSALDGGRADDEVVRDFYVLSVKKWVAVALEEIDSIDQELEILKRMDVLKNSRTELAPQHQQPARPPMKPFILTKDAVQAKVFGAGYPSLATVTVDEWYEQHRRQGVLPDQGIPRRVAAEDDVDEQELEDEKKENRVENDDEEALKKARSWDDWKDTHRRGYGNRKNMG